MSEVKPVFSETDSSLSFYLMPNHLLKEAEQLYAGRVRLIMAWHYGARLNVDGIVWNFFIEKTQEQAKELQLVSPQLGPRDLPPLLWELVWHRAAEASLAVRRYHAEARVRAKERKEAQAQNTRAAV